MPSDAGLSEDGVEELLKGKVVKANERLSLLVRCVGSYLV